MKTYVLAFALITLTNIIQCSDSDGWWSWFSNIASQSSEQKPRGSARMGRIRGKNVKVTQTVSADVPMQMGDIQSDGEVICRQECGNGWQLSLSKTSESGINGTFFGADINNEAFNLKTTKSEIIYQGKSYPYDGRSICTLQNSKLTVPPVATASSAAPTNSNTRSWLPLKYAAIGGSAVLLTYLMYRSYSSAGTPAKIQ